MEPLTAVTVTPYVPARLLMQERVADPFVKIDIGLTEQNIPVRLDTVNVTVPPNRFRGLMVTVEVPLFPTVVPTAAGYADIEKSGFAFTTFTTNIMETECVRLPEVPVTVTLLTLGSVTLHPRTAVPVPPMNPGVTLQSIPVEDRGKTVRETFPANPSTADTAIVEVPVTPCGMVIDVGFAEIMKSGRAGITLREKVPLLVPCAESPP